MTFSFVVNHTGDYGDAVTNTAEFFHPASGSQDSAGASFVVVPAAYIYVPMIMK